MTAGLRAQQAAAAYGRASETISPARQIVMLYDGAARRIGQARTAILERRVEDRYRHVMRAHAIVSSLQGVLDLERGGDVARLLDQLYGYVLHRLVQINLRDDAAICDELIARLGELRSSWARIALGEPPTTGATMLPAGASPLAV
jgi:flagellar protein FliS